MDRLKRPSATALICAAALSVIAFLSLTTVYSSDDFSYSTYFDNGIRRYLPLMVRHYQTMNGRTLVHIAAHVILHFGSICFCLVCLGCCILIPLWASQRRVSAAALGLFLCCFLAMPSGLLNQGVMWISAFCNYTLPCAMLCGLLALLYGSGGGRLRMAAAAILALLCGATTEQAGAMALVAVCLYLLWGLRERRRIFSHALICLFCAAAGYVSIFLSPATRNRFQAETSTGEAASFLSSLYRGLEREAALITESFRFPLLLTMLFLVCGYCLYRRSGHGWRSVTGGLGILSAWVCGISGGAPAALLLLGMTALIGLLLIWERVPLPGTLMVCAAASACIMLPTNSIDHRSLLPLYLLLSAAASTLAAPFLKRPGTRTAALALAFVTGILCILPTVRGYWYNYQIDLRNHQHLEEYRQTGTLRYCMDYDLDHTWIKPYHDGVFHNDYLAAQGLPASTEIFYYSSSLPAVYLEGKLLSFPAIERPDGGMLLPLRAVAEGLGGRVEAVDGEILVTANGQTCTISREREYAGIAAVTWTDPDGASRTADYPCSTRIVSFCIAQELLESLFGITVTRDDSGIQISNSEP